MVSLSKLHPGWRYCAVLGIYAKLVDNLLELGGVYVWDFMQDYLYVVRYAHSYLGACSPR